MCSSNQKKRQLAADGICTIRTQTCVIQHVCSTHVYTRDILQSYDTIQVDVDLHLTPIHTHVSEVVLSFFFLLSSLPFFSSFPSHTCAVSLHISWWRPDGNEIATEATMCSPGSLTYMTWVFKPLCAFLDESCLIELLWLNLVVHDGEN